MPELLLRRSDGKYIAAPGTDAGLMLEGEISGTPSSPTANFSGKTVVVNAGSRVALSASKPIKSVAIKAGINNTGIIYLGGDNVSESNGAELAAGESASIEVDDLSKVYVDASANGQYVTWIAS